MLSHVGQCGQPRPEPVSRTVAPVATIASSQPTAHQATQRNRSGESSSERRRGSDRVADSAFTTRSLEPVRQWVLTCTSLGMLLATVNSGTLIIALPELERSLHTTPLQLVWVILVYMIVSTMLVLTAGRLSDLFGRKNAYVLGFLLFSAASLGAGFAGSGTQLILGASCRASAAPSCSRTRPRSSPTRSRSTSSGSRWGRTRWSPRSAW